MKINQLLNEVVDLGQSIHKTHGFGLPLSSYETFFSKGLEVRGFKYSVLKPDARTFEGLYLEKDSRTYYVVGGILLIDLKSVEKVPLIQNRQVLAYLRLLNLPLGVIMNLGARTYESGVKKILKDFSAYVPQRYQHRIPSTVSEPLNLASIA